MTNCPYCASAISLSSKECPNCGRDLSEEQVATVISEDRRKAEPTAVLPGQTDTKGAGALLAGTLIGGRYRLITSIGKGGMGEVYKADDLELGQTVALKFLPSSVANDDAALKRFRSEVRTARQVAHPNVCRVFDIAEANGLYFITMEYIDGDDLSMLLRRIGRLPSDKALETSRQLCLGLHAIHQAGILHRDLKPANIIIDSKGKARITDFGIAGVESDITRDDFRSGTPAYMSPEQLDGKGVTQKSDIYSLGLLLYEIFTGKQAIQFESLPELLVKHQTTTPTNPSEILKDIDPLVEKTILQCLEKDPDERPKNALQVALMLPGGNPLEAAIAAGETPSPAMVAASPKVGTVPPKIAAAALAACFAMLALITFVENRFLIIPTGELSSELLAARSRETAAKLGYTDRPLHAVHEFDRGFSFGSLREALSDFPDPAAAVRSGQPALRVFRYRESAVPIVPRGDPWVTSDNPPFNNPGDVQLVTDPLGRIIKFEAIPAAQDGRPSGSVADWGLLFEAAGLDPAKYSEAEPERLPISFADERKAWSGPFISNPDITVRVEAAAYNGRPVYFEVVPPWTANIQTTGQRPPMWLQVILALLTFLLFAGIIVLSWHNFRTGRGDLKGSLRVMIFTLGVGFFLGVLRADHVADLEGERSILGLLLSYSLFNSVLFGVIYSALEPQIRRFWPELLVSWSRVLAGNLRDPLVGRDLLFGSLLGLAGVAIFAFQDMLLVWLEAQASLPRVRVALDDGMFFGFVSSIGIFSLSSLGNSLLMVALLFIFLFLFRRRWLALIPLGAMATFGPIFGSENDPSLFIVTIFFGGLYAVLLVIALKKFGIVGLIGHQFFVLVHLNLPASLAPGSIYFGTSVAVVSSMVAVLLYAYSTSIGLKTSKLSELLEK